MYTEEEKDMRKKYKRVERNSVLVVLDQGKAVLSHIFSLDIDSSGIVITFD
jgi:hypothetical protein